MRILKFLRDPTQMRGAVVSSLSRIRIPGIEMTGRGGQSHVTRGGGQQGPGGRMGRPGQSLGRSLEAGLSSAECSRLV